METRQPVESRDFFISHAKADQTWAEWIASTLEDAGYSTFLQAWDSRPGDNLVESLSEMAAAAGRTILVLSPSYLESQFNVPEWARIARESGGKSSSIVPVRVEECEVTGLGTIAYLDLVGIDDETEARQKLLSGLEPGRVFPASEDPQGERPDFPGEGRARSATPDPKEGLVSIDRLADFEFSSGARFILDRAIQTAAESKGADAAVTATVLVDAFRSLETQGKDAIWFLRDQLERRATSETSRWIEKYYEFYSTQVGPPISTERKGKYPIGWLSPTTFDFLTDAQRISVETNPQISGRIHARHLVAAIIVRTFDDRSPVPGSRDLFAQFGIDQTILVGDFLRWFEVDTTLIERGESLEKWLAVFGRLSVASGVIPRIELESPRGPDLIGIDADVDALASIVAARNLVPPLAIGLFGDWGSGKSFFMEKLHERIDFLAYHAGERETRDEQCAFHGRVVQIMFNAWNYVEANLWASLVTHIFESLHNWFQPKDAEEEKQWQKLLQRLDEASMLRDEAEQGLAAAQNELKAARDLKRTQVRRLVDTVAEMWDTLARSEIGGPLKSIEKSLNTEELLEVKESLLLRRDEAESLLQRLPVFRRTLAKGLGSLTALGAFGVVMVGLLGVVFGLVALINDERLNDISGQIAAGTALVGSVSAWLGTAFKKATSVVDAIHGVGQALDRGLAEGSIDDSELRAAEEAVVQASRKVEDHEELIGTLRRELGELQPSRRLTNFLASRAESSDYRKHLGLPAMIRRDFEHLQALMDEMVPKSFELPESARERLFKIARQGSSDDSHPQPEPFQKQDLGAPEIPSEFFEGLRALKLDMTSDAEVVNTAGEAIVRDPGRDFEVRVRSDGKCRVSWQRLRIDRIVLYIDDLDRCPSERVVEVLQAIRLLLDFKLFVVVVGVDARWVTRALATHHGNQWRATGQPSQLQSFSAQKQIAHAAEPQDFLEKIFQIPLWLEPLEVGGTRRYLRGLTGGTLGAEKEGAESREVDSDRAPAGSDTEAQPDQAESETAETETSVETSVSPEADAQPEQESQKPETEAQKVSTHEERAEDVSVPDESVMNPPGLELDPVESEFMLELAGLMGRSPRAVKRFVNVYRLLRAGITESKELKEFIGSDEQPGAYRTVQFLLAVIVGTPSVSDQIFSKLREGNLQDLIKYAESQMAVDEIGAAKRSDWRKVFEFFNPKEGDPPSVDELEAHIVDWVDRTGRYSFRVGRR